MLACRHSEQWLRGTIRAWLRPAKRHASTSSAINRGLRATKGFRDDDRRGGRQSRGPSINAQQDGPRDVAPTRTSLGRQRERRNLDGRSGRGVYDREPSAGTAKRAIAAAPSSVQRDRKRDTPGEYGSRESSSAQRRRVRQHEAPAIESRRGSGLSDRWEPTNRNTRASATSISTGRNARASPPRPSPAARSPLNDDDIQTRVHFVCARLTSVRNMDAILGGRTDFERREKIVDLRERLKEINRSSHLVERARSLFSAAPQDQHGPEHPLIVQGAEPPIVKRTALWLSRNSKFALVFPTPSGEKGPAVDGTTGEDRHLLEKGSLMTALKRVAESLERLQWYDISNPTEPLPALETEDARTSIEALNVVVKDGELNFESVLTFVGRAMGRDGVMWSRSPPTGRKTYLHVGKDDVFRLALRKLPDATTEAPKQARAGGSNEPRPLKPQPEDSEDDMPLRIPYTTAASSFVYGSNTVLAALRAQRRKFYHLYLHPRMSARDRNARDIRALAKQLNVRTTDTADSRLLDKMSEDRPHNGVVLEASRLPAPPVLSLAKPYLKTSIIPLVLDRQSAEDVAVNGAPGGIPTLTQTWRHPFVLMLDGITDEGNLGNILRTAHFYGVDAVAIATPTCAPLNSAILAKASSGACEALRILALPRPNPFIYDSSKAGWKIYAAVAPPAQRPSELRRPADYEQNTTTSVLAQSSPLAKHPVILMLGAEGEGLGEGLKKRADHFVTVEQGERAFDSEDKIDVGVDSLNVGVATGVLVEAFMRKPEGAQELSITGELGF